MHSLLFVLSPSVPSVHARPNLISFLGSFVPTPMPLLDLPDDILSLITLELLGHSAAPATATICHRLASVVRCPRHWKAVHLFFRKPQEVSAFGYPKLLASSTSLSIAVPHEEIDCYDWHEDEDEDDGDRLVRLVCLSLSPLWLTRLLTLCLQLETLSIARLKLEWCWLLTCAPLTTVCLSDMPMLVQVSLRKPSSVAVVRCPRLEKITATTAANLRRLELDVTNLGAQALHSLLVRASLLESLTLQDLGDVEDWDTSDTQGDDSDGGGLVRTIPRNPDRIQLDFDFFTFVCMACPNLSGLSISSSDAMSGHPDLAALLGHRALRHIEWRGGSCLLPGHPSHDRLLNAQGVFSGLETLRISGHFPNEYPMRDWAAKCPNVKLVELVFPGMTGCEWPATSFGFEACAHLIHEYTTRFRTVLSAFDCSACEGDGDPIYAQVRNCGMVLREDVWREQGRLEYSRTKFRIIGVHHSVKRDGKWDYGGCVSCPVHEMLLPRWMK